ncbi:hypothetical protein ACW7GZ_08515 [Luteimonas sp. A537]
MANGQGDPPVDLDDALAVLHYGQDALDSGLEARVAAALDHADAAALVACLEDLRRALQAHDPRSARRGVGLVGRLMGRDVLAESEAVALRTRMGTLVAAADRSAAALEARGVIQQQLQARTEAAITGLDSAISRARDWLEAHADAGATTDAAPPGTAAPGRANLERRLGQLATVQTARQLGLRQLELLHAQDLELLARYRRIRDVLLPAWRQQALAEAGTSGRRRAGDAAKAWAAIESEVDAMAGKLD